MIATGGLAGLIALGAKSIEEVDENLTLEGLRIIYRLNKEEDKPPFGCWGALAKVKDQPLARALRG